MKGALDLPCGFLEKKLIIELLYSKGKARVFLFELKDKRILIVLRDGGMKVEKKGVLAFKENDLFL